jgi:hypothetical protein
MKNTAAALGRRVLEEILSESRAKNEHKKRARCEENWAELVVAVLLSDSTINTKDQILNHDLAIQNPAYSADLGKRPVSVVYQYIQNFKKQIPNLDLKVDQVYLLGKNQQLTEEIEKLQAELDRKDKKSDVMAKTESGQFVGFSVKSGKGDTLTNYSIEKILPNSEELRNCRLRMIEQAGLPLKLKKELRPQYNNLFRGKNDYHTLLVKSIMENKEEVLSRWASGLFAKTPFPVYSFDGDKLRVNSFEEIASVRFDLNPIPCPSRKPRGAGPAKIFFEVTENGKPSYLWDIRWKGSVFASPQIQTHRFH